MSVVEDRHEADRDIEETLGLVPSSSSASPTTCCRPSGRASNRWCFDQTAIPNKYKEMIGLAVSGATRCRYCGYFHAEAARLFGATEDEITETAMIAKNTMGWSTYLNTLQFDYDAVHVGVRPGHRARPRADGRGRAGLIAIPAAGPAEPAVSRPPQGIGKRSRARSKSPNTRSSNSTASAGGGSGAARIASSAIRAPRPEPKAPDWSP